MEHSDAVVAPGNVGGGMGVGMVDNAAAAAAAAAEAREKKRKEEVVAALDARGCSLQTLLEKKDKQLARSHRYLLYSLY
jgi:Tfp pilus assembly protein FimV